MKVAMLLFPLMMVVCISHALPVQPEVESTEDLVHIAAPLFPRVEDKPEESIDVVRHRRSPFRSFQPNRGGGGSFPMPQPQQPRGSISGGINRAKGVGTIVHGQGQGNVWTSKDGNTRVDAQGEWSKVVNGPGKSKPNYNVGATFSHDF